MLIITGDTHGDFRRFNTTNFPKQKDLCKDDFVIVCGDFGIWDDTEKSNYWLDWLNSKPFTTLFVDGNHENFDLLNKFEAEYWNGGKIHKVRDSIFHLRRGQVFNIHGKKIFTMGGAQSHDIKDGILEHNDPLLKIKRMELARKGKLMYRINHLSWWEDEMPNTREYNKAIESLDRHNWSVDYVITHCAPTKIQTSLSEHYKTDRMTDFLNEISNKLKFEKWFFGHYHDDIDICNKFTNLYTTMVEII